MKEIFKASLKKNRWEGIAWTEPHEFTNDAVVARWREETDKWKAVRKQNNMLIEIPLFSQKDQRTKFWES